MKNIYFFYKFFLFSVILAVSLLFSATTFAENQGTYLENTRLREIPSLNGKVLLVVPAYTTVIISEEKVGWYKVKLNSGTVGWSKKEYLRSEVLPENPQIQTSTTMQKLSEGRLLFNSRIRKTPLVANNIIEVLSAGSRVKILEVQAEWYRVEYNSTKVGWIMSELVAKGTAPVEKISETPREEVPDGVDSVELNKYWLGKVNALRSKKDLRLLVLDPRWEDTATEWAQYMGRLGYSTHTRSDGKSMHKWIDTKGLDFTVRNSEDGWKTNYFTENIAWGIASPTTEDVKKVLDNTLKFFLSEAPYNGDHYRTIYHKDWNSVGLGFSFKDQGNGKYKVFVAMHYGSLQNLK